jgi:hypothetical protein
MWQRAHERLTVEVESRRVQMPSSSGTPRIGPSTHRPSREVKRIILGAAAKRPSPRDPQGGAGTRLEKMMPDKVKKLVRARMQKTGESYQTALCHVTAQAPTTAKTGRPRSRIRQCAHFGLCLQR